MGEHCWMSLNMSENAWIKGGFLIRPIILDTWQGFEYASGIIYAMVLNMARYIYSNIIIIMYWASSWGSREVFQPKMPYYAKMGACPMKNSGMTFTFMWNLESLCIHNLAYTIPLVGHGQGLVHSTCLTWDFLNTYHMFFHEAIRVCTAQTTN